MLSQMMKRTITPIIHRTVPSIPTDRPELVVERPLLSMMPASISRRSLSPITQAAMQSWPQREKGNHSKRRSSKFEQFEPKRLLAVSPRLVSIIPNEGELLTDGQTRDVAPRELTFRFSEGQIIDPTTLGGIQIVRSGFDGVLGDGDDVLIEPGYIGIGDRPNEVVARFADTLPDDLYQIHIFGAGANTLRPTIAATYGARPSRCKRLLGVVGSSS